MEGIPSKVLRRLRSCRHNKRCFKTCIFTISGPDIFFILEERSHIFFYFEEPRFPFAFVKKRELTMPPAEQFQDGFWGTPTATLEWCEKNYDVTFFIAEFCKYHHSIRHTSLHSWL